jgi:hypothetical protein
LTRKPYPPILGNARRTGQRLQSSDQFHRTAIGGTRETQMRALLSSPLLVVLLSSYACAQCPLDWGLEQVRAARCPEEPGMK